MAFALSVGAGNVEDADENIDAMDVWTLWPLKVLSADIKAMPAKDAEDTKTNRSNAFRNAAIWMLSSELRHQVVQNSHSSESRDILS